MNNGIINRFSQDYIIDIFKALEFASFKHRHQKRKGAAGIPYINHPIGVALQLLTHLQNPSKEIIITALLHDILEDTSTKAEEIKIRFGEEVLNLVKEVTDDMSLSSRERKEIQIIRAGSLSKEAQHIKIADKICNIRDILATSIYWTRRQKIRYIENAVSVISRIKNPDKKLIREFKNSLTEAENALKCSFTIES